MKVQKKSGVLGFTPFELVFTVESVEEARALYSIFNYCPNLDLLPVGEGESIRHIIGEEFDTPQGAEIANGVTYDDFFRSKEEK